MHAPIRRLLAVCCVVALAVSACSGSSIVEIDDDAASDGSAADEATRHGDAVVDRPFDDLLIELFDTTDTEAYLAATERVAAELVVTCMNNAGFEFSIPPGPPASPVTSDRSELEVAQVEGFGIIRGVQRAVENAGPNNRNADRENQVYLSTLTADEIGRFFITLDGTPAEPGQVSSDTGCTGAASDEAFATWNRFTELLPNYTAMTEERDSHPDWLAGRAVWQDCMVARGYDFAEPDAVEADVRNELLTRLASIYPGTQLPLVQSPTGLELDPAAQTVLTDLAQVEIDAAVANAECTEPIAGVFDAVEHEVQTAFVERHRDAIESLLAD